MKIVSKLIQEKFSSSSFFNHASSFFSLLQVNICNFGNKMDIYLLYEVFEPPYLVLGTELLSLCLKRGYKTGIGKE